MKYILYVLTLLLMLGCGSQKKTVVAEPEPRPSWVSSKPVEGNAYSGIGMAYKSSGSDFIAIAKNNALNDLASEISVNISSNSLFYQIEQDDNLRAEFQANTRLKSKENLEGYELVASYENANEYWVYYKLNKAQFLTLKEKRLQNAIGLAKQFYTNSVQFKEQGLFAESIKFNIKALAALKDYLADPITTTWNDQEVFIIPELYSNLQETVSSIKLIPPQTSIATKRGQAISSSQLYFLATNKNGDKLAGLPVYFFYSGQRITNNQLYTNANGVVGFTINKVTSTNNKEYFQANINMVALVSESTDDPFIRKLVAKISAPEARIEITIEKPQIYIESTELNLDKTMANKYLANAFKQNFIAEGFDIANSKKQADYFLKIEANTQADGMQQKLVSASLYATITFTDHNESLLYEKPISNFKGVQLTTEKAGEDAYRKLASEIDKRYFREMRRKVFD